MPDRNGEPINVGDEVLLHVGDRELLIVVVVEERDGNDYLVRFADAPFLVAGDELEVFDYGDDEEIGGEA